MRSGKKECSKSFEGIDSSLLLLALGELKLGAVEERESTMLTHSPRRNGLRDTLQDLTTLIEMMLLRSLSAVRDDDQVMVKVLGGKEEEEEEEEEGVFVFRIGVTGEGQLSISIKSVYTIL